MGQTTIFDMLYPKYKIKKPIRLIEFFAGYGSQALALKYLGVEFEHYKTCEWAIKSIQAYKDIHFKEDSTDYSKEYTDLKLLKNTLFQLGISNNYNESMTKQQVDRLNEQQTRTIYNNIVATHNLVNIQQVKGEDLKIVDTDKYDYILTYSFPCQDLSLAGKGKGMSDTSTRSGMLWEVERILKECNELGTLPQILLMENVPQVHSQDNVSDFNKWQYELEKLGYKNYFQDLIATDYGIPQTRNRCFMISILGDYSYKFPKSIPLKLKLKDMLEKDVDEKYYIKDGVLNNIISDNQAGYLSGGKWDKINESARRYYKEDGNAPTIHTCSGGNTEPKIAIKNKTKQGYLEATDGDGIDLAQPNSETRRGRVQKNKIQTLTTQNNLGVVTIGNYSPSNHNASRIVDKEYCSPTVMENHGTITAIIDKIDIPQKVQVRKYEVDIKKLQQTLKEHKKYSNKEIATKLNIPITTVEHWFRKDKSFSIPDKDNWYKLKKILEIETNEFDKSITTYIEKDNVYEKSNRCYLDNGVAPTLTATSSDEKIISDLRIRKLTPKECFRLMGVKDEDYEKVRKNQSDSSLYHLAGDSIVVNVLMAIFKELL